MKQTQRISEAVANEKRGEYGDWQTNLPLAISICEKIKAGLPPDVKISEDFTPQEVSKFYSIINSYNSQTATLNAMKEYIDTIVFEKGKLTKDDYSQMTPEEIMQSLKKKPKN